MYVKSPTYTSYLNKTAGAKGRWETNNAVTKVDTMKNTEESVSEDSIFCNNFGKEVAFATTTVESDTKQPGEHHDSYRTMIWRRYTNTHSHTPDLCLSTTHRINLSCCVGSHFFIQYPTPQTT